MSKYPDLSPYIYTNERSPYEQDGVSRGIVNIGWLGVGMDYTQGECPYDVVKKLISLATSPVNIMRGLHYCEFCDIESPVKIESKDGVVAWLGTGEIHVPSSEGLIYSAPTLIVHYIQAHRYLPPQSFCDAVISMNL
jgi:hypothetical protein